MNTVKINSRKTKMIAHRGVSGLEKENTLAAFIAAGNRSYWGIETDVHVTADGSYVIIHDDSTLRVSGQDLCVEKSTLASLQQLRLQDTDGVTVRQDLFLPTLQDYLRVCKRYEKYAVLELKNRFTPAQIQEICDIARQEDYLDHTVFISFSLENLLDLRKLYPEQAAQYLVSQWSDTLIETLSGSFLDLDIHYAALTRERIQALHAAQILVNAWTVNDEEVGEDLTAWGIDYVTSNILE